MLRCLYDIAGNTAYQCKDSPEIGTNLNFELLALVGGVSIAFATGRRNSRRYFEAILRLEKNYFLIFFLQSHPVATVIRRGGDDGVDYYALPLNG